MATSTPPAVLAGHEHGSSSISGHIDVVTRSTRRLATAGSYPSRTVGVAPARHLPEIQNVVVFVESSTVEAVAPMRVRMRQTDEEFVPHVVAITAGSTVDFPNDDLVFHNVFSLSRAATFDLGRYPRHASKSRTFAEPGIVKVFCHLHSHMSAIVRVFAHPHFTIPDEQGRFTLAGLPSGRYTVAAWHERIGDVSTEVTVLEGGAASVSLSLPLTDDE